PGTGRKNGGRFFRPVPGLRRDHLSPSAGALGYYLAPLRAGPREKRRVASNQFLFHRLAEGIDVANRAVDVGRDAQAGVGVVGDVDRQDAVLAPQGLTHLAAIHLRDEAEKPDAAGLRRVGAVQDPALGVLREAVGPAVAQVTQARRLAVDPQVLVEDEGFGDGVVIGRGVSTNLLELANIVVLRAVAGHHAPGARDAALAHVEETGAHRRVGPLVQAGAIVVAIEIGDL